MFKRFLLFIYLKGKTKTSPIP